MVVAGKPELLEIGPQSLPIVTLTRYKQGKKAAMS